MSHLAHPRLAQPVRLRVLSTITVMLVIMTGISIAGITIIPSVQADDAGAESSSPVNVEGKRVCFLGASITHAGQFISIFETQLRTNGVACEMINLGLPSETCSGLSEPAHPFPRPNVLERLDRVLEKAKPDVLVVCYGINDAIYHPFTEDRFDHFKTGINQIIKKSDAAGVQLILSTPLPFDRLPGQTKGNLYPLGAKDYSWENIYQDYDDVMKRYGKWILEQQSRVAMTIDLHTAMTAYLDTQRESDPKHTLSNDGIHVNAEGHQAIAEALMDVWDIEAKPVDAKVLQTMDQRQRLLRDAWLSHIGHLRPGIKPGQPLGEAEAAAEKLLHQAGFAD